MREKAIIWNKENTASIVPKARPSKPVVGGDVNAARTTTTSAKLTIIVAMNWKAAAASSEGYGCDENVVGSGQWLQARNETSRAIEITVGVRNCDPTPCNNPY